MVGSSRSRWLAGVVVAVELGGLFDVDGISAGVKLREIVICFGIVIDGVLGVVAGIEVVLRKLVVVVGVVFVLVFWHIRTELRELAVVDTVVSRIKLGLLVKHPRVESNELGVFIVVADMLG